MMEYERSVEWLKLILQLIAGKSVKFFKKLHFKHFAFLNDEF
jgi:hypothetical protein